MYALYHMCIKKDVDEHISVSVMESYTAIVKKLLEKVITIFVLCSVNTASNLVIAY